MGFMGLSHWVESDGAADFEYSLRKSVNAHFRKELKNEANCYNTPGWLNALLLFKSYPQFVAMLDDSVIKSIDDAIEADNAFCHHKNQSLVRDYVTLVANFRKLAKKAKET